MSNVVKSNALHLFPIIALGMTSTNPQTLAKTTSKEFNYKHQCTLHLLTTNIRVKLVYTAGLAPISWKMRQRCPV